MRRGVDLSLDLFGDCLAAPAVHAEEAVGKRRRMLRMLHRAALGELTGRQIQCVRLYYGEGKSMEEVACCLGVTRSTVSRHLKKARARLHRVMEYGGFPRCDP